MKKPIALNSRRLTLRKIRKSDLKHFYANACRDEVSRNAGFPRPRSIKDTRSFIDASLKVWKKGTLTYSMLNARKEWVGGIDLRWPHPGVGEIGYAVHPDHWGQGYAPEAARRLILLAFEAGAHRVQATCWVGNKRSAKVLRKIGMRKEGRLRDYLKRGDWVRDEYMYAITRRDVMS